MNTPKIAGLYQAVSYAMYHQWAKRLNPEEAEKQLGELDWRVRRIVYNDFIDDAALTYRVSIRDTKPVSGKLDFFGDKRYNLVDTKCPLRVLTWAQRQMPAADNYEVDPKDRYMASIGSFEEEAGWNLSIRVAGEADFATLMRGMLAFERKRQKYTRKILAQLRAYHRQQVLEAMAKELSQLRSGMWLGADKALTSPARSVEPTIQYMGDADPTAEQRQGLHYWMVPEDRMMTAALPAGTGVALRLVTSHKQLIDGALYLSQVTYGQPGDAHYTHALTLGRLDKSRKEHGYIPMFWDDKPAQKLYIQAEWRPKKENQRYEVKLMQVVYYTTSAETLPATVHLPFHAAIEAPAGELALAA